MIPKSKIMWNTFIVLGDSIAEGAGDIYPGYENVGWVDLVAEELIKSNPGMKYYNFAVGGSTVIEVINDQVKKALNKNPDLITLIIGGNDARDPNWTSSMFSQQYSDLINSLMLTDATLVTMTYPNTNISKEDLIAKFGDNERTRGWLLYFRRMKRINQIIRRISGENKLFCMEFEDFEPARDPKNLSQDMVHPNSRGYWYAADHIIKLFRNHFV
jgi:lysophospholipase L1-like esterase